MSLCCALLITYRLDWSRLFDLWHRTDYRWVILAAVLILTHTLARAARWRAIFAPPVPPFGVTLTAMLVGQTMNYLLPARSGDIPRAYWLGQCGGQSGARALGAMAVEKVLDLGFLVLVLLLVPLWAPASPSWLEEATWGTVVVLALLYILLRIGAAWQEPLLDRMARVADRLGIRWWTAAQARLARLVEGVQALRQARLLWRPVVLSLAAWIAGASANLATLRALGLPGTWPMALTVSAALRVGIALPALPASVGVYEGAILLALGLFAIDRETALGYGVLMHLVDFLPPVAMTLWLVWRSQLKPECPDGR